jgi:hypothetical protein
VKLTLCPGKKKPRQGGRGFEVPMRCYDPSSTAATTAREILRPGQSVNKAQRADVAHQSDAGNLAARFAPWKPIFCLGSAPP